MKWGMRVALLVGSGVMNPVGKSPEPRGPLQRQRPCQVRDEPGCRMKLEAPVREHPMITKGDANASGETIQSNQEANARPTEMKESSARADMHQH